MAEKKKKKMEFRYYQLPPGSPILDRKSVV